ncbi:SIS domain-containing protein [Thauera linaloolentis]|uniref:Phosphoheptose isomerase n=1 Tax=Thauera linaloolentis (strain DSM 12138 / JCM 21573 / CCUG 41526 / CIP 105981 / IAM 15112 / NBRC 102519 / 47Lol) TaxID=1123367 RepID=N6Z0P5_THAL4|nr:SIS domain-containing protein [Thauera linaloolentis]ENO85749.1 phosphoheptose isomerase [Thauera linaloolentis 47Lol = DSM 12138]MCM8564189.1 SIS domain-containing protein [Thauera linaloolentis]
MDLIARISRQFQDNTRATLDALEMLAAPIAGAIEIITASLLDNGKILVCGGSGSSGDARRFAAQLVNGFELERPSLAAFALSADASTLAPLAGDPATEGLFSRQILALGQPGDILLTLSPHSGSPRILEAIGSAHERDMRVIALTGADGGATAELLGPDDIHIFAPATRTARIQELHLLILHCLCDGIDCLLLGVED